MAIYHYHAAIIGRSAGKSSVASAAYRCGGKFRDERTGVLHDYSHKAGVDEVVTLAPDNAPAFVHDPAQLWNKIEILEKRKDAQLARDFDIALPRELSPEHRRDLALGYVQEQFTNRGMVAMVAFHDVASDNPHIHIMTTLREVSTDGFGNKNREWNDRALLQTWREQWAQHANLALERAGVEARIDHRTLVEQRVFDREASQHQGPHAAAMEKRGLQVGRTKQPAPVAEPAIAELEQKKKREQEWNKHLRSSMDDFIQARESADAFQRQAEQAGHALEIARAQVDAAEAVRKMQAAEMNQLSRRLAEHKAVAAAWKASHPVLSKFYSPPRVQRSEKRAVEYAREVIKLHGDFKASTHRRDEAAAEVGALSKDFARLDDQAKKWRVEEERREQVVLSRWSGIDDERIKQDNPALWQKQRLEAAARKKDIWGNIAARNQALSKNFDASIEQKEAQRARERQRDSGFEM